MTCFTVCQAKMIRKKPDHIWKMLKCLKMQSLILIIWHVKDQGGLQSPREPKRCLPQFWTEKKYCKTAENEKTED